MLSLILVSFIGGFLTIAAPCILAVLPIILGSTIGHQSKLRPLAIVFGLTVSFTGFGILFTYVTNLFGLSNETLRTIALFFLALFGLALVFPVIFEKIIFSLQQFFGRIFPAKNSAATTVEKKKGIIEGFFVGASLGLVWVPCAGPILGTILTLAISQANLLEVITLMVAYSLGAGIPMLLIAYGGNFVIAKLKFLKEKGETIKKISGIILLLGVAFIGTGLDVKVQTALFEIFPQFNQFEESLIQNNQQTGITPSTTQTQSPSANGLPLMPKGTIAPELTGNQGWINSQPLKLSDLRGKVVIVDFWTYSCINCIRTLPYMNTWYKTYKDQGLVIIGVHTPEFAFEKELKNVQKAVKDFGIEYPVVQDNDYQTWRAYDNHYWPAKYIIDKEGNIRFTHFGEGEYDQTEQIIRALLQEGGQTLDMPTSEVKTEAIDFSKIASPETYLGYGRSESQGNPEPLKANQTQTYAEPTKTDLNHFYLVGDWNVGEENVTLAKAGGKITMVYKANKINLVMDQSDAPVKAHILLDGKPIPPEVRGQDVQADGTVTIDKAALYNLVDTGNSYGQHEMTIIFDTPGAKAFAFTFG